MIPGVMGITVPSSSSSSDIVNLLKSNILREELILGNNLLPVLFYKKWEAKNKMWKKDEGGFSWNPLTYISKFTAGHTFVGPRVMTKKKSNEPELWDALRSLDNIIKVNRDNKDNTITITSDYYDPEMAAKFLDLLLVTLTDHMSSEARRVATINKKYLEEQLQATADPFIKQKIYNLIASQIETSMMTEVKENFAFKVIDPPRVPDKKIKPQRAQMVMLSFVVSLFIGVFIAFLLEYLEKMKLKATASKQLNK
jgi:uncharacterized protein involved in exopolysaccharide biosynthesis